MKPPLTYYQDFANQRHLQVPNDKYWQHDKYGLGDYVEDSKVVPERGLVGSEKVSYVERIGS